MRLATSISVALLVAVSACSSGATPIASTDTSSPASSTELGTAPVSIDSGESQGTSDSSDSSPSTIEQAADDSAPRPTDVPFTADLDSSGGVDGPVMYWRERPPGEDESEDSEIAGTLVREGNCLFLEVDAYRSTVLWEFGTRWDADRSVVQLPDGSEVALDSKLPGRSGGEHSLDQLSIFTTNQTVIDRARECAGPGSGVSVVQR